MGIINHCKQEVKSPLPSKNLVLQIFTDVLKNFLLQLSINIVTTMPEARNETHQAAQCRAALL